MNEVWFKSRLVAYPASIVEFSKVAAPLLAGFSLTAVVEISGRPSLDRFNELAIMCFAIAAALLVFAIQTGLTAATYQASPDERMAWTPEARGDIELARRLRIEQWDDERTAGRYRERARHTYNIGIISFLVGLGFALAPEHLTTSIPRLVGLIAVAVASLLEVFTYLGKPERLRKVLSPTHGDIEQQRARRQELDPPSLEDDQLKEAMGFSADPQRLLVSTTAGQHLTNDAKERRMAAIRNATTPR